MAWLAERAHSSEPADLRADFAAPTLLRNHAEQCESITEVYNCAGAFRFGMSVAEARRGNVDTARRVVEFVAGLPHVRRLVHVSGYRVGGQDFGPVPWSARRRHETYTALGAYEGSKVEADAVLRALADTLGVAWSVVNPCTVIGDSRTGETNQYLGLATTVRDLWQGTLRVVPGDTTTWVPVVPVDHLADFMVRLPMDDQAANQAYWVLNDDTPALPDLLALIGGHLQVTVPCTRLPVSLVRRLPRRVTRTDQEALNFLASDRYPTDGALAFADRHALTRSNTVNCLHRWVDHLVAHRFGEAAGPKRRFTTLAGVRTLELGDADAPTVIVPGLPVGSDTWESVRVRLATARTVDAPGLGLSGGDPGDWEQWTKELVGATGARHLVGHSTGAAIALSAAANAPGSVRQLTLIAPFFLQQRPGPVTAWRAPARAYLQRVSVSALARRLTGDGTYDTAFEQAVSDLRRNRTAAHVADRLAATRNPAWRRELRHVLRAYPGPVHVVVGDRDPLSAHGRALVDALPHAHVTVIPGAGDHPHLTHPGYVADAIRERVHDGDRDTAPPGENR